MSTETDTQHAHNDWVGGKGTGAFDLRSDTRTLPTPAMLAAVQTCTLQDDLVQEDRTTLELEAHIAKLTGKEAALFILSGIMGNQLGLRTNLTQPPHAVLCDHRSHIMHWEAGSTYLLSGAKAQPVRPKNGLYLTLEDVQANVVLGYDIHSCPTRVISLENTIHGVIMPLEEVRRISAFAREHRIRMHCDGARLWEAVSAGAGSLPQFCELFDTVTMCFSKGLCAPVGSIIVGSEETIKHCRWIRSAIGGGLHKPGLLTAAAKVAVDETFGTKPDGSESRLKTTHHLAKDIEALWMEKGGRMTLPVQTNMCWLDLDDAGCSDSRFNEVGRTFGLKLDGSRLVIHCQIYENREEVLRRLGGVFSRVLSGAEREANVTRTSLYQA